VLDRLSARRAWEQGARCLGVARPGETPAGVDETAARQHFARAVEVDPTMADGWLGLHRIDHEASSLTRMLENAHRLGDERRATGRDLWSWYEPGWYVWLRLTEAQEVRLAMAAAALADARLEDARGLLQACAEDPARTFLHGRLLYQDGDFETMFGVLNQIVDHPFLGAEARLCRGIALARRTLFSEAERVLTGTLAHNAETVRSAPLGLEARYFRAGALRGLGRGDEARAEIEWVYSQNPQYLAVAEMLADPTLLGFETQAPRVPGAPPAPTAASVAELIAELDVQPDLHDVKAQVQRVAASMEMAQKRAARGLPTLATSRHLVFAGPPGTGKTTVARLIGRIYHALGALPGDAFIEASRVDLVGEYLGQTAPKTNAVIDRALGGILFIDEAYSLQQSGQDGGDTFGTEAVNTLLKRMEDDRDQLAVIIAGYPAEMTMLLGSNPGLASRFSQRITFNTYGAEDLVAIAELMARKNADSWSQASLERLSQLVSTAMENGTLDTLGNARFVRNLYERASQHRDLRLHQTESSAGREWTDEELCRIEDVDLAGAATSFEA
jgi:type VII secretion ATPase EccA